MCAKWRKSEMLSSFWLIIFSELSNDDASEVFRVVIGHIIVFFYIPY
jgi:hypothetical protein